MAVYTTTGQTAITTVLEAGINAVDVSKLTGGMYYIKVGETVSKLIK